jgi:hypothetical protein
LAIERLWILLKHYPIATSILTEKVAEHVPWARYLHLLAGGE